ncbi:MAG TPA: PAS domain S-box protein [Terriglobales bacterium]|nr:PAS domain S-box protein [Terriglobales bacterium]
MHATQKSGAGTASASQLGVEDFRELASFCAELGASPDFEQFLQLLCAGAAAFCGFSRTFIGMVDDAGCEIQCGFDSETPRQMRMRLDTTFIRQVLYTKRSLFTDNAAGVNQPDPEAVRIFSVSQYMTVPVIHRGDVVAILGLLDRVDGSPISPTVLARAETLAAHVAVILESMRNLYQSEQNRRRSEILVAMALELGSSLGLPDLVHSFTVRAASLMGARGAALSLTHGSIQECVVLEDSRLETSREVMRELGGFFTSIAQENLRAMQTVNSSTLGELQSKLRWNDLTLARLVGGTGELLGVLCLADCGRALTRDDEQMILALTGHASIALENSRLFSKIAQSNKQWSEIFDALSDYIVVHDDNHRVMRVNQPLSEFIGARPAEMIGIHMRDLLSGNESPGLQPCPFCLPEAQDEVFMPMLGRTFLVSTSRIHGALHEGLQTIHVLRDVTDRRDAERRYRELFDNVQEGVFFCDAQGKFIDVNDALVRMLGYDDRDELLSLDVPTLFYASREQYLSARKAAESESTATREVTLRRKNGALLSALESSMAVRDSRGEIVQYRGLLLDITDAKLAQYQLQREKDFNTQILNNTQSMIMVADTAGLISYANPRCYEAGQFDQDSLVGHRMAEFVAERDRPEWEASFDAVLLGEPINNFELHLLRGDGGKGKFSANISPMHDTSGNVNSIVVVMTDITDVAVIREKLMHTEKLAAVGQLVSGVAHEVNNPLTAIMGFADLMLENPKLPKVVHQDLRVIMQEAQRTKEIVQNLLSFARQTPPQRKLVDINAIVKRTIALRSYDFASHGVKIVERFDENVPEIVGDAHQLQQVFLNIMNNAYDALREVDRRGRIEIETENVGDGYVRISFRDNGPGVEHPERIFDPFFTTKDVGKGTGLGLSICYGIVREHGGEIMCRPQRPEVPGATFCVRLPTVPTQIATALEGQTEGEIAQ